MELFSKSCEAVYLGWNRPLLDSVASEFENRFTVGSVLDMSHVDCVLPSLHSSRRLKALLEQVSADRGLEFKSPRLMTVGQLMEALYRPRSPLANDFEQTLAWARSIRSFSPEQLQALVPVVPSEDSLGAWLELAGTVNALASELSAQNLSFEQVRGFAKGEIESRRWDQLCQIHEAYLRELDDAGLADPSNERTKAISKGYCEARRLTVLIGTSDLSPIAVQMLRRVPKNLIAMIGSPESESSRFDEFGSVIADRWKNYRLSIETEPYVPAGDMMDQAAAVASHVREFAVDHDASQITVGVTDDSQVAPIELELRGCGVRTYRNLGWTLANTSVGRLVGLATTFVARQSWQSLASLVRHSDVHDWVTSQMNQSDCQEDATWHLQLDQFISNHFPVRLSDPLPPIVVKNYPQVDLLREIIMKWFDPFWGESRTISQWTPVLIHWLGEVFQFQMPSPVKAENSHLNSGSDAPSSELHEMDLQPDSMDELGDFNFESHLNTRTRLALIAATTFLMRVSKLSPKLDMECTGGTALEMLSSRMAYLRVVEKPSADRVNVLGWLDLALSNSPALVINGYNHPFVPSVVSANAFLPAELRQRLPTEGNDRRYARDLYATQLILSSRKSVALIVGKVGADQNPTPPSRLLAASDKHELPERLLHVLEGKRSMAPALHQWDNRSSSDRLVIPSLGNLHNGIMPAVESLSVTAFRDYLVCPYRFYLRHVLKLRPIDDAGHELAANQFGDLVHGALEDFGRSDQRDESDPEKIEVLLKQYLEGYVSRWYSIHSSSVVQIQVAQAERRLKAVALVQAKRIAEGWRIHEVEASVGPKQDAKIAVDGQFIPVKGRFDRIDVRTINGLNEWAILDYKTHGHPPEKKHLRKTKEGTQWIDLQLPLYRMMIPYLGIKAEPSSVRLGYFNISAKDEETKVNEADFSEALMLQAEELVKQCVRNILNGNFEPTSERVEYDDYESILQTGVASRLLNLAASGDEEVVR